MPDIPRENVTRTADRAYAEFPARLLDGAYGSEQLLHEDAVAADLGLPNNAVHEASGQRGA